MEEKELQEKGKAGSEAESSPSPDTPSSEKRKKKRKRDETKDETGCEAPPVVTPLVRIRKVGEFYLARGVLEVFARFTPMEELPATSQPKADKKAESEPPAKRVEKPKAAIHEMTRTRRRRGRRSPCFAPRPRLARGRRWRPARRTRTQTMMGSLSIMACRVILFLLYIL